MNFRLAIYNTIKCHAKTFTTCSHATLNLSLVVVRHNILVNPRRNFSSVNSHKDFPDAGWQNT